MPLYQQNKDCFSKKINQSWYIISSNKKHLYILNSTSSFLWKLLKSPHNLNDLTDKLSQEFDISPQIAKKDITRFIHRFHKKGFIQPI